MRGSALSLMFCYLVSQRRFYLQLLSGMIVLFAVSGCGSSTKIPEVPDRSQTMRENYNAIQLSPIQERSLNLSVGKAQVLGIETTLQTTGQVQAVSSLMSHSYAPVLGQVISVPVSVGKHIQRGQVLARLRSDQVGQLQSEMLREGLQVQADLKQAQVQLKLSQTNFARETRLFNERIAPRADMETARAQYEKDQAMLANLREKRSALITSYQSRLTLYGADGDVVQRVLQQRHIEPYISITAPRSGLLIDRNINQGELVDTTKELFTIADLSRVWLTGNIYEKDIPMIHLGQPVRVRLDSLPDTVFQGSVSFVDAMLDPQTRTLEIRSEVLNPHLFLKPNMFARVEIQTGIRHALAVPNQALQRSGDYMYVYVAAPNHHYIEQKVITGISNDRYTEVLSGLRPNEAIVVEGTFALKGEFQKLSAKHLP